VIRLVVLPTPEVAALTAADRVVAAVAEAQSERGAAHVSLAGGTTPLRAYELLAQRLPDPDRVDWWFGDERCVGPDDPDSNYRVAAESLLTPARVPAQRVHRIHGEDPPESAAAAYDAELRACLSTGESDVPVLDIALLGLGEDGHTASLFPGDPALGVTDRMAVPVVAAKPPPNRITLTLPVLRGARLVLVLATGAGKADAVARVLAGPDPATPASLLAPAAVELLVDQAAAP
jgi:6-phosphogluconolactonase